MDNSPFTDNFPSNFGAGDGQFPAWTHVHGTRQLDAEYLGTEPHAIDQTLDWENFLNLDQVELGVFPSGSDLSPLDIGTRTYQYCGLPGQETTLFTDQGQERKLELGSPGDNSNTGSLASLPALSRKRKFSDFQEGSSRGPNGSQHLGRGASKGGTKGQNRIPKKAKATLMAWLEENQHDPYPDKRKIEDLSVSAGLELAKVRNWLNNARQRHLPKASLAVSSAVVDGRNGSVILDENTYEAQVPQVPAFRVSIAPHSDITTKRPRQLSPPMERYLASPPEHEAAPLAAVEAAAENTEFNFDRVAQEAWTKKSEGSQDHTGCDGFSISGSGTSVISSSNISYSSLSSHYPRKGRRRAQRTHSSQDTSSSKFQCTFCSKGFQTVYDWKRHEESRHVPQEEWVCMPDNAQILCDYKINDSKFVCTFCGSADASYAHLESAHNIHTCLFKEIPERTFTRKDHLVQHIRHTHKAVGETPYVQNWSRPIRYNHDWDCGFCGERLGTWSARVSHIARHFARGLRMDSWVHNTDPILRGLTSDGPVAPSSFSLGYSSPPTVQANAQRQRRHHRAR